MAAHTIEEALDMGGSEAGAEAVEGSGVIDLGDAVVERLIGVAATLQLAAQPLMSVKPDPDAERRVGAEADESWVPSPSRRCRYR